jgi:hypothetical protein
MQGQDQLSHHSQIMTFAARVTADSRTVGQTIAARMVCDPALQGVADQARFRASPGPEGQTRVMPGGKREAEAVQVL